MGARGASPHGELFNLLFMYDLFNMDAVAMDSPRLVAIKKADIQTHHNADMEEPWLAVPMNIARSYLSLKEDQKLTIVEMMAEYCGVLDNAGMVFTGKTERDVQDAALAFNYSS